MTYEELKKHFKERDDSYMGYFDDVKLNRILNQAYDLVVTRNYYRMQRHDQITAKMSGLIKSYNDSTFSDTILDLEADIPDFKYPLYAILTYTDTQGLSENRKVRPVNEDVVETDDPFSDARVFDPALVHRNKQLEFFPKINPSGVKVVYIRTPDVIDVSDDTTEPLISIDGQYEIIEEALIIVSKVKRDGTSFQLNTADEQRNP